MAHTHSHSHKPGADDHPLVGHLVPISTLVAAGTALLVLTVITVAVRYVDLGEFNIHLALGIALVKAIIVGLVFMHLWWDRPFNQLIFVASVVFVVLLMAFVMMDSKQYQPQLLPGNPKAVQDKVNAVAPDAPIAKQVAP